MVLIDRPSSLKMIAVVRIETGMAVSEMAVVRQLSRNANRMTATTRAASSSTRSTFWIEFSMKLAWRKMISLALTPDGRLGSSSASTCVICCVSFTVSTLGCFSTETITAGLLM